MTTTEKRLAETYRLPQTSTPENLACNWSTVINFGDKVILAAHWFDRDDTYFGAVYDYTTKDHTCEGEVRLVKVSSARFKDNGHALQWAMNA